MTFKVNWKRTNRGLWLAGIAIVIVAINIIIDNYQFKNEKEDIMDTVYEFTDEVTKALISPTDIIEGKAEWSEDLLNKEEDEIDNLYEKYWTDTTVSTYVEVYKGVDELDEDIECMLGEIKENKGYVKSINIDYGTATINTYGPDGAAVTMEMDITVTHKGVDTLVYGVGSEYGAYYMEEIYYDSEYSEGKEFVGEVTDKNELGSTEQDYAHSGKEITIILLRENGQWKISGVSYY